jgi:hypothetical protein
MLGTQSRTLRTSAVTITRVWAGLPPRQSFDGKNSGSCGQVVAIWIAVLSIPTARYCTESTDTTELVHWQFDRHNDFFQPQIPVLPNAQFWPVLSILF